MGASGRGPGDHHRPACPAGGEARCHPRQHGQAGPSWLRAIAGKDPISISLVEGLSGSYWDAYLSAERVADAAHPRKRVIAARRW